MPSYCRGGHAGAIHIAVGIRGHRAENLLTLCADGGEHTPIVLWSPAAELRHLAEFIYSPHVDRVLRTIARSAIALLAVERGYLRLARGLVIPGCEYML